MGIKLNYCELFFMPGPSTWAGTHATSSYSKKLFFQCADSTIWNGRFPEKVFGFIFFQLSDSNPGRVGTKRESYRCAMPFPQVPSVEVPVDVHLVKLPLNPLLLVVRDLAFRNGPAVQAAELRHDQLRHVRVELGSIRLSAS